MRIAILREHSLSPKKALLDRQRSWAQRIGAVSDSRGYLSSVEANLFQPLSERTRRAFSNGCGSELIDTFHRPAKMKALHSSAALAVNVFDYWAERDSSQVVVSLGLGMAPASLAFEAQFPTGLEGNPPNLDLALRFASEMVVGMESKFSEWLTPRSPRKEHFKAKYFPEGQSLWANSGLRAAQELAAALHNGEERFRYLDAVQLLKHMLGLANTHRGKSALYYLFYEWPSEESSIHRAELKRFQGLIARDMPFHWGTYQQVFQRLAQLVEREHGQYIRYLRQRYFADAV